MTGAGVSPPSDSGPGRRHGAVVGVDGSPEAANAYQWAVARGGRFGPVTPVAAWHLPWWYYIGAPVIAPDGPGPDIERDAAQMVDELVADTPPGSKAQPVIARGPAGRILVDVAQDASLLVVGTRGRGALADQVLGSVSSYCAAHSPVPLAVVPENAAAEMPSGSILVGIDGSPGADAALDWALAFAAPDEQVIAYQAWDIPVITGYESIAIDPTVVESATVDAAARCAAAACERANLPSGRVEVRVGEGDARGTLQRIGAEADLVVVGRRGQGRLTHALLGSVTTSLVHHPETATVVVPPAAG